MRFQIILLTLILVVFNTTLYSCSNPRLNPTTPVTPPDRTEIPEVSEAKYSGATSIGYFDALIQSEPLHLMLTPPRKSMEIGDSWDLDIQQYLESNPCGDCLRVSNIGFDEDGRIVMDVGIRHPFPADAPRDDLDVFDVRLIILSSGDMEFPETLIEDTPIIGNFEFVGNPDGYTTHYDDGEENLYAGNLNPYISYFTENDPSWEVEGDEIENHRMPMGVDFDYKRLYLNIPPGMDVPFRMVVEASYGHSAKRSIPEGDPGSRTNPLYYIPEFNRKEVYSLQTRLESVVFGLEAVAVIDLEMLDWQAGAHVTSSFPAGLGDIDGPSGLEEATLEIPELNFFSNEPTEIIGTGTMDEPLHARFNVPMSSMSVYPFLAAVRDNRDDEEEELDITTYQYGEINTFIRMGENSAIKPIYTSAHDSVLGQGSIAVDQNRVYVTWADVQNFKGVVLCSRSVDGGMTFNAPVKVNDNNRDDSKLRPSIAVDEAHSVYIVWEDYTNLNPFSDASDIYMSKSNNYAYSFGQDIRVNDYEDVCDDNQTYPMIACKGTGNIYVTWMEKPSGSSFKQVKLAKSINGGSSFLVETNVSSEVLRCGEPVFGLNSMGIIWVAWRDYRYDNQDIFATCSTDNGQTFGIEVKVNDDTGYEFQTSPTIAVDNNGVAYVAWQDSRDPGRNDFDIYFAYSLSGTEFSPNIRVNRIENVAFTPKIALASGGGVFVVYRDMRDDYGGDIYVTGSLDKGQTFSIHHDVKVNDDSTSSIQLCPQIAVGSNNKLHIVWGDGRDMDPRIFYAQSIFP